MEKFDPYRKWLGIPPQEQPPNHYRLLGIGLFESDPDVISNAADRQMVHLRSFQSGKHSDLSQRILNEVSAARVCLLDARKKGQYDAELRAKQLAAQPTVQAAAAYPAAPPPGSSAPPPRSSAPPPPRVGGTAPPAPAAAPVPQVRTGGSTARHTSAAGSYGRRRRKSAWKMPLIAIVAAVAILGLLFWALNRTESRQPEKPGDTVSGRNGNAGSFNSPLGEIGKDLDRQPDRRRRTPVLPDDGSGRGGSPATDNDFGFQPADLPETPEQLPGATDDPPAQPSADETLASEPLPVPDKESLQAAKAAIKMDERFTGFGATDAETVSTLIKTLRGESKKERDAAKRLGMLELAREKAIELRDAETALEVVDEIGAAFDDSYEASAVKQETLVTLAKKISTLPDSAKPAAVANMIGHMIDVANETNDPTWLEKTARPLYPEAREGTLFPLAEFVSKQAETIAERGGAAATEDAPPATSDPIFGATDESTAAVDRALVWLAGEQQKVTDEIGYWSFAASGATTVRGNVTKFPDAATAATALALLPFLAAGNDRTKGEFRDTVELGLLFLQSRLQSVQGSSPKAAVFLDDNPRQMPSHALATLALCEACGQKSTAGTARLRANAKQAINYITQTQNPDDGWGCVPTSSSSVLATAWTVAAIRSSYWADLSSKTNLRNEEKRDDRAREYLKKQGISSSNATANAGVILSRMYLGGLDRDDSVLKDYATPLSSTKIVANLRFPVCRFYFDSQVMRHYAGPEWEQWNIRLRKELVRSQADGSWVFEDRAEPMTMQGGPLFCTVMAALILEVYHRHPSLYE